MTDFTLSQDNLIHMFRDTQMAGERGVVNLAFLLSKENLHKTPGAIEYQPISLAPALPTLCANFFQGRTPFFFFFVLCQTDLWAMDWFNNCLVINRMGKINYEDLLSGSSCPSKVASYLESQITYIMYFFCGIYIYMCEYVSKGNLVD